MKTVCLVAIAAMALGCGNRAGGRGTDEGTGDTGTGDTGTGDTGTADTGTGGTDDTGSTGGTGGTGDTGGTGGDATDTTIEAIQSAPGSTACNPDSIENVTTGLALRGVTVTGPKFEAFAGSDTSPALDGWYVSEGSGVNKGIQLVAAASLGLDLAVGDQVDAIGEHMEFYCNSQFRATEITKVGDGGTVETTDVSCADLVAAGTAEPFEGVLVKTGAVEVTETGQFEATLTGGCKLAGKFKPGYFANLGDKFTSVTGIVEFSFNEYKIQPRSMDDLGGFEEAPVKEMTISEIQMDPSSADCSEEGPNMTTLTKIQTSGVVISPAEDVSANLSGFYLADEAGGAWSGILVIYGKDLGVTAGVGDAVTVTGNVKEFFCLTEFSAETVEVTGAGSVPVPVAVTAAEVAADGEKYEGVRVGLENLEITDTTNATMPGSDGCDGEGVNCWGEFSVEDGSGEILVSLTDYEVDFTPGNGDSISALSGVIKYSFGSYKLVVLDGAAIVTE